MSDGVVSAGRTLRARLRLHGSLREHAGGSDVLHLDLPAGATVDDLLDALASAHPAVERRIRDETGVVRRHVNLFLDGEQLRLLGGVGCALRDGAEVLVLPAVSGG